jgi:hypothetical protein
MIGPVAALLLDALHLPVVAALISSTVEVVEGVTAIEMMTVTVTGVVMSAALMVYKILLTMCLLFLLLMHSRLQKQLKKIAAQTVLKIVQKFVFSNLH